MVWDEHTSNGLTDEFLGFIGCDVPDAVCGQGFGGDAWAVHTETSVFAVFVFMIFRKWSADPLFLQAVHWPCDEFSSPTMWSRAQKFFS